MAEVLPDKSAKLPQALIVVGMAGAGKTTFVTALYSYLRGALKKKVYCINLDPGVDSVSFPCNIDIRDTVNYKKVMKEYGLGPNGAILTSLNLFATKFNDVLNLIEKRLDQLDYILIDTPGQIEVFNWSASGSIILESLSLIVPSALMYLLDSSRCQSPTTLMSSLLYSCSLSLKSKIPSINVMTKSDLLRGEPNKIEGMITDYAQFCDAAEEEDTYSATLAKSACLSLQEFYAQIPRVRVAVDSETQTLQGFDKLVEALEPLREDYFESYLTWVKSERNRMAETRKREATKRYKEFKEEDDITDDDSDRED